MKKYTIGDPASTFENFVVLDHPTLTYIESLKSELSKVTLERNNLCMSIFDQRGKPVNEELLNKVRVIAKDVDLLKQAEKL